MLRCELRGARSAPERIARRNITFSPRRGTPVIVTGRRTRSSATRIGPRVKSQVGEAEVIDLEAKER
jgi:hypothetical protein